MTLKEYLLASIVPRYEQFDMAHRSDHALKVIEESLA
ncbi:MAG: phosphohydrolase, partial [Bacteroidales bacterium]|nr:phosphohydrolase [Bacteroidales bacterium]